MSQGDDTGQTDGLLSVVNQSDIFVRDTGKGLLRAKSLFGQRAAKAPTHFVG